jgi:hypothetical protein
VPETTFDPQVHGFVFATDQPPVGSSLRLYLSRRLLESWAANGLTFLEWIARLQLLPARLPFDAGPKSPRDRSCDAWRSLKRSIDAGQPVPIGLVGEASAPLLDRQVLAYGYGTADPPHRDDLRLRHELPGVGQTIEIDLTSDVVKATESCPRTGNELRGFFWRVPCGRYAPAIA